ncbi:ACT domain-containing protein [Acutalibacter sp. 1XD8-33]|uniref:phosphoglycerate dehydrogenase n=1 Tax=Acutalibacter sp. 1XD8-33 TaxID=2320081 RepID=UPI000EA3DD99|nr:phosphoglycerate dehydrogenase [Acutalibacter sp. 1XD8-33]RKJ41395.1 ACT domain-containing protein [Acutalibacter sp. 1XD8-33]
MYKILCLNKISPTGTKRFGESYTFSPEMKNPDAILVRSASMHGMDFEDNLLAIARAGAGVNNVPVEDCAKKGIAVFNTPGANANAVKELVLCALLLASRKIAPAMDWVKTLKGQGAEVSKLVEKGKSQFAGPEIQGKTLGVVGLGAIGILVANAAHSLGMEVYGYDPFLSVDAAWRLSRSVHRSMSLDEIYQNCDYITLHLPATAETKGMINGETIGKMKDGARLLNFARGELVDSAALLEALESGKIAAYATDFPTDGMLGAENVIALPHLGASTPESEDNCAQMAVDQIKEYLENGNIINSVNLPGLTMSREPGTSRMCVIHRNVPGAIATFTSVCGQAGINIENMQSKSRGEFAYTVLDVSGGDVASAAQSLENLDAIIRVRVIH